MEDLNKKFIPIYAAVLGQRFQVLKETENGRHRPQDPRRGARGRLALGRRNRPARRLIIDAVLEATAAAGNRRGNHAPRRTDRSGKDRPRHHGVRAVSYTHLRAHETVLDLVCRLLLEKKKKK